MGWKTTILWVKSHFYGCEKIIIESNFLVLRFSWTLSGENIKRLITTLSSGSSEHCTRPEVQACSAVINKTNFIDSTVVSVDGNTFVGEVFCNLNGPPHQNLKVCNSYRRIFYRLQAAQRSTSFVSSTGEAPGATSSAIIRWPSWCVLVYMVGGTLILAVGAPHVAHGRRPQRTWPPILSRWKDGRKDHFSSCNLIIGSWKPMAAVTSFSDDVAVLELDVV